MKPHVTFMNIILAQWAVRVGEAGWTLAESNLLLTAIFDLTLGLGSKVPFAHRFQAAGTTIGFDFVKAVEKQGGQMKVLAQSPRTGMRSSKYERWHELPLEIPPRAAGSDLMIEIGLRGPPPGTPPAPNQCSATISLRRLEL